MPYIHLTGKEEPIPLEKAVVLKDFLIITKDLSKGLKLMRDTCLEGRLPLADVNCAAYQDQITHYAREMLKTPSVDGREYVESLLRRMGPEEYALTQDVEALWKRASQEYPDLVESRAGPEFLEEELFAKFKDSMAKLLGTSRATRVHEIRERIEKKETEPSLPAPVAAPPPGAEAKELEKKIEAEEAILMRMKEELRAKMGRIKGQ